MEPHDKLCIGNWTSTIVAIIGTIRLGGLVRLAEGGQGRLVGGRKGSECLALPSQAGEVVHYCYCLLKIN